MIGPHLDFIRRQLLTLATLLAHRLANAQNAKCGDDKQHNCKLTPSCISWRKSRTWLPGVFPRLIQYIYLNGRKHKEIDCDHSDACDSCQSGKATLYRAAERWCRHGRQGRRVQMHCEQFRKLARATRLRLRPVFGIKLGSGEYIVMQTSFAPSHVEYKLLWQNEA